MLLLANAVFLMIPRTGTTWARQAMRNAGVRYKEWGPKHSTVFPSGDRNPTASSFRFTFVRSHRDWVRSRWTLGPWEDEFKELWSPDPEEFATRISEELVDAYFSRYTSLCGFVGKIESIADDLVAALKISGTSFSERDLRKTPRINESSQHLCLGAYYEMPESDWCRLPPEEIIRMPTDLLPQLPEAAWDRLEFDQFKALSKRLASEAVPRIRKEIPVIA